MINANNKQSITYFVMLQSSLRGSSLQLRCHCRRSLSIVDYSYLHDLQSSQSLAILQKEQKILRNFENENKNLIKALQKLVVKCSLDTLSESENTDICGSYEYCSKYKRNNQHPIIYRRLCSELTTIKNDLNFSDETYIDDYKRGSSVTESNVENESNNNRSYTAVLDINQLMTIVPNILFLSRMEPSLDQDLLAFTIDHSKSSQDDIYTESIKECNDTDYDLKIRDSFFIKRISTNTFFKLDFSDTFSHINNLTLESHLYSPLISDFEWGTDSTGQTALFLILNDSLHRPYRVMQLNISDITQDMSVDSNSRFPREDKIRMQPLINDYKVYGDQLQELVCEDDVAFNIDIG
jgi:protease II